MQPVTSELLLNKAKAIDFDSWFVSNDAYTKLDCVSLPWKVAGMVMMLACSYELLYMYIYAK